MSFRRRLALFLIVTLVAVQAMTAIFTYEQIARAIEALTGGAPACVSVFAGRLADFGIDYRPIMRDAIASARKTRNIEIIWASTREVDFRPKTPISEGIGRFIEWYRSYHRL